MKKIINAIHKFLWKIKMLIQQWLRSCKYRKQLKENLVFQDKYTSEKCCFVIGNGPSLSEKDLDKIASKGFVTFASNSIFKLFPDTNWRPTYYSVCDTTYFNKMRQEIETVECTKFIPIDIYDKYVDNKQDYHVYYRIPHRLFRKYPRFSDNMTEGFGEGGTVTYHLLQLAVSMGFKEIYLLGCDFNYSFGIGPDGKPFIDNSVQQNHLKQDNTPIFTPPNLYYNILAFQSAELFTRKHGIRIYNATRGGKLEIFERKDFDSMF